MNEIFIILDNSYSFVNLIFENYKNEFTFHNKKYNFEFIEKNKLKIYNIYENYILDTLDSFIFTDNISKLLNFKLIELNHNEWFDQALLNNVNNEIIRIRDRNQYGKFEMNNEKLIIDWNYWGKEIFLYYDSGIYNTEKLIKNNIEKDILVFMHVCNLNDGIDIFEKQLKKIEESSIYDEIKKIYIFFLGEYNDEIKENNKIEIIHLEKDVTFYEFLSINKLKEIVDNDDNNYKILYLHNKGVNKSGNSKVVQSWREMMEYFLIEKGLYCYKNLNYFDTIGCNIINKCDNEISKINNNHAYHYSGNFWWSKSSYIKNLKKLEISYDSNDRKNSRFQCENWILSNLDNKNIGIIYQDNTNIHPYHRYIFNNYKNKELYIKKLNN